jgi:hypothetical protein
MIANLWDQWGHFFRRLLPQLQGKLDAARRKAKALKEMDVPFGRGPLDDLWMARVTEKMISDLVLPGCPDPFGPGKRPEKYGASDLMRDILKDLLGLFLPAVTPLAEKIIRGEDIPIAPGATISGGELRGDH